MIKLDPSTGVQVTLAAHRADAAAAEAITLDMQFAEQGGEGATPYEVLLHAAMIGKSTRFTRCVVPVPRGLSRTTHPAALGRSRSCRLSAVPRTLRRDDQRDEHGVQPVRSLHELRRIPLRGAREVRCRGHGRAARARARERRAHEEHETRRARDERSGHRRHRGRRRARWGNRENRRRHRHRRLRRGEHREAAAPIRKREAPERPRQHLRPGRTELHVPREPGRARALPRGDPDDLPEDTRAQRLPHWTFERIAQHAIDFWLSTEDLPRPDNRVTVDADGNVALSYKPTNEEPKKQLYAKLRSILGKLDMNADHLIHRFTYMKNEIPVAGCAHQAGTCRFGTDPATSVVNTDCRAHELDNLYVVDTSVFPSIGAVNPALTAMANALRVGDHLLERVGAAPA